MMQTRKGYAVCVLSNDLYGESCELPRDYLGTTMPHMAGSRTHRSHNAESKNDVSSAVDR